MIAGKEEGEVHLKEHLFGVTWTGKIPTSIMLKNNLKLPRGSLCVVLLHFDTEVVQGCTDFIQDGSYSVDRRRLCISSSVNWAQRLACRAIAVVRLVQEDEFYLVPCPDFYLQ